MSTQKPAKMKLWLRIVLAGSLGLNLAVAGLAIGAVIRFRDEARLRPAPSFGALLFRELDKDTRRALRQKAGGDHGSFHDRRRAEGDVVLTLLRADPFEPDALSSFFQGQASSGHDFRMSVQQAWVTRVVAMSEAERASYADELQQRMHHPHGKLRHRDRP
ncbi:MAG: hypothetical protein COB16_00725 [Rhodobacteraceae bacterium]|nr:MAG: hypothetical protein COB16_00725 [Paracoccaceae bacterium]